MSDHWEDWHKLVIGHINDLEVRMRILEEALYPQLKVRDTLAIPAKDLVKDGS